MCYLPLQLKKKLCEIFQALYILDLCKYTFEHSNKKFVVRYFVRIFIGNCVFFCVFFFGGGRGNTEVINVKKTAKNELQLEYSKMYLSYNLYITFL